MKWLEKTKTLDPQHKRIIILVLGGFLIAIAILDVTVLHGRLIYAIKSAELIGVIIFFSVLAIVIGVAVMQVLFLVAAELSLVIFLGQAYCEMAVRTQNSDDAVKLLVVFGILYVIWTFISKLRGRLIELFSDLPKEEKFWNLVLVIIILALTAFFVWQVYQVIFPTINGLCVYKDPL